MSGLRVEFAHELDRRRMLPGPVIVLRVVVLEPRFTNGFEELLRGDDPFGQLQDLHQLTEVEIEYVPIGIGIHLSDGDVAVPKHHSNELVVAPQLDNRLIEAFAFRLNDSHGDHRTRLPRPRRREPPQRRIS